jgi:hypothetical protein
MRKEIINNNKVVYYFDSITDMQKFSEEVISKIPLRGTAYNATEDYINAQNAKNSADNLVRNQGINWYGTIDTSWVLNPINNYIKIQELEQEVEILRSKIAKADVIDIDQVKRIHFTEKEVGIFSYDLASLGLIKVYEYYSPLFKTTIDGNFVVSENKNFYFIGQKYIPRHEVKYNESKGGFYSNILGRLVDKKDLEIVEQPLGSANAYLYFYPKQEEIPRHQVEQRQKIGSNGKPMFTTTFKKCFINIEKAKNPLPRIDLIVLPSFSSKKTASEIFYNSIAIISICEKLSKSNVNYRILASYDGEMYKSVRGRLQGIGKKNFSFVNIKNENQNLDINQVAILSSDARFYRVENFKLKLAMQYDSAWGTDMQKGVAIPITDTSQVKDAYMEYLSKQTSQSDRDAATRPNTKIVIPIALSREQAEDAYNTVISQISRLSK